MYRLIDEVKYKEAYKDVNGRRCWSSVETNLIHDFTAVTFSVKLAFFREKRPFP